MNDFDRQKGVGGIDGDFAVNYILNAFHCLWFVGRVSM
ncbi:hypothetical protein VDG1235_4816 [Verrucomicrobiia bacterium DG1235]|nr:hypothetical protein VDG1235_4816 [Verrucomicrobiae bacterium DG1235]